MFKFQFLRHDLSGLCSSILFLFGYTIFSQDISLPQLTPPSPTVSNLMSFEEVPVDYYTGQPDIGIPLFSKKLNGNLGMTIALKYHTSGVKIDNRSGWTGTGWSLFAGGSISRTVRGTPDEFQKGPNSSTKTGVLHNPDFWDYDNISAYDKAEFNWNAIGTPIDEYDSQLDLYQFNVMGISGRFVIVLESGGLKAKLLDKSQNVKININYNTTSYDISSFELIDAYGHKYLFDVVEETYSQPVYGFIPQGNSGGGTIPASGTSNDYTNTSSWHLKTINNSNGITLVTLNYNDSNESYVASFSRTTNIITEYTGNLYDMTSNVYNQSILRPSVSILSLSTTAYTKKLSSIVFRDGTKLEFTSIGGHPETNGNMLKDVIIKNTNNQEFKRFTLEYETTDRLWLDKVKEIADGTNLITDLSYYQKENLPEFNSESDDWGYTDGAIGTISSCQPSNFDIDAIKYGLLTSIEYPTNGRKEFVFEHNTFAYEGNSLLPSDNFLQYNPNNISNASHVENHSASGSGGIGTSTPTTFTLGYNQEVLLSSVLNGSYSNEIIGNSRIVISNNSNFETEVLLEDTIQNCFPLNLESGTYDIWLKTINLNANNTYTLNTTLRVYYSNQNPSSIEEALGGGVRIKEIRFNDFETPFTPEKTITYSYREENNLNRSSGSIDAKLGNITIEYSLNTLKYLFSTTTNYASNLAPRNVRYNVKTKGNSAQLTKGGYVGYKNVIVSETNNGKTVYNYTSPQDYPTPSSSLTYPFVPAPNLDFKRGLLLKQRVYNNNNQIVSEKENTIYTFEEDVIAPSFRVYDNEYCQWRQFYDEYSSYYNKVYHEGKVPYCGAFPCISPSSLENCGSLPIFALKDYIKTGWAQLKETNNKEYFYDAQGVPKIVESRQTFDYNTTNFQIDTQHQFIEEKGIEKDYKTKIYYAINTIPSDYQGASSTLTKMQALNMINNPVYTISYLDNTIISKQQTIFNEFNADKLDIKEVWTEKNGDNTTLEMRVEYLSYDEVGNPLELARENGPPISFVWGFNKTLPVAKLENATRAQIEALSGFGSGFHASAGNLTTSQESALRGLSNTMVTTYIYDALNGPLSVTDPRGNTTKFTYDGFGRLKETRDVNNKLVTVYEYHYKNQQ
ncbi:RHS repeat domain-containing protein [uncultured Croceitalea sp.]|uniref:RHS repeat domain-containing protein n=1 Tax=uncultured Croceitalea sp. TaxID=1798908 RepID=UPI00374E5E97